MRCLLMQMYVVSQQSCYIYLILVGWVRRDKTNGETNDDHLYDGARRSVEGVTGWDSLEADQRQMHYVGHHWNGKLKGRYYLMAQYIKIHLMRPLPQLGQLLLTQQPGVQPGLELQLQLLRVDWPCCSENN